MSLADATSTVSPVSQPLAVLAGVSGSVGDTARIALEAAGHRVDRVAAVADLATTGHDGPIAVVVVDADELAAAELGEEPWASVTGGGGAELFALHRRDDDVSALWCSFRAGAVPWSLDRVGTVPGLAPVGTFAGELALDALHEELLGRHVEACRLLSSIRDPEMVAEVVDVLVAAGAASLERLRNRSRYPVPTELLVQHLPAHVGTLEGKDFSLWWNMVEAVAFRASGLRLPAPGLGVNDRRFAVVFGAFHATSTIVRFTARRQWRQPADLLGDLAEVE